MHRYARPSRTSWSPWGCGSAQAFLRRPRPEGPSCLVLDVRLPGLSGLQLQQELAGGAVQMPIIFITGHSDMLCHQQYPTGPCGRGNATV